MLPSDREAREERRELTLTAAGRKRNAVSSPGTPAPRRRVETTRAIVTELTRVSDCLSTRARAPCLSLRAGWRAKRRLDSGGCWWLGGIQYNRAIKFTYKL